LETSSCELWFAQEKEMHLSSVEDTALLLYERVGGDAADLCALNFSGSRNFSLPSVYDASGFAASCVGVAGLAAARLQSVRMRARQGSSKLPRVDVDIVNACAAFQSETLLDPHGWELPSLWDPLTGNYLAAGRWIRLHTNYAHHRRAALEALGLSGADGAPCERSAVEDAVRSWDADALETEVVSRGGAAARMYDESEWLKSSAGTFAKEEKPLIWGEFPSACALFGSLSPSDLPLWGIRVLDLTRVIAGPDCTRFLASLGATVLRVDPPGFEEVPTLVIDTTVGKRCASLNLRDPADKLVFEGLLQEAHVLVTGYRRGALESLGFSLQGLRKRNPSLIVARLNAYGFSSPWGGRRGFDSLVQMSVGIAAAGANAFGVNTPVPLPMQALDHGAGHIMAAGVCQALVRLWEKRVASDFSCSLSGVASALMSGAPGQRNAPQATRETFRSSLMDDLSAWGPLKRVAPAVRLNGQRGRYSLEAGPLGRHSPSFFPSECPHA
jgi:hypothetical protein